MFSAGESSGDKHAANLFLALKNTLPLAKGIGMGGKKMQQAGMAIQVDSSGIGVIGISEIIEHFGEIYRALKQMKQLILNEKPDLLICVDYKEFNLRLARFAKKSGVKVLFYVSPQVWASRPGRVVTYGKAIDMMAVIFPFETQYYEAENVPVTYVGHPSVDKVTPLRSKADDLTQFSLQADQPIVGLLPGSRANEINRMLPVMLAAAEKLLQSHPTLQFILPQADSVSDELLQTYLNQSNTTITLVKQQPYDAIQCCDAIMTTSGTATLEISLLNIPMVITYKLSGLTYFFAKYLVNIPFIGLPNIIAGKSVIKELIQHEATADNLADEINRILDDTAYREIMRDELADIKIKLGKGGGSQNMADLAVKMLTEHEQ